MLSHKPHIVAFDGFDLLTPFHHKGLPYMVCASRAQLLDDIWRLFDVFY